MRLLKHLFTAFFLLFSVLGFAQKSHYYVLFSARFASLHPFSIGGHGFITWRGEGAAFPKTEQLTYGFFPHNGSGFFKNTEGAIVEGYVKNSKRERWIRRFIMEIDSALYAESLDSVATWQQKPYSLFHNNCVHFIDQVAQKLALKTPSPRFLCFFPKRPTVYIRKLKKLNHERLVKNAALERVRLRILRKAKVDEEEDADEF